MPITRRFARFREGYLTREMVAELERIADELDRISNISSSNGICLMDIAGGIHFTLDWTQQNVNPVPMTTWAVQPMTPTLPNSGSPYRNYVLPAPPTAELRITTSGGPVALASIDATSAGANGGGATDGQMLLIENSMGSSDNVTLTNNDSSTATTTNRLYNKICQEDMILVPGTGALYKWDANYGWIQLTLAVCCCPQLFSGQPSGTPTNGAGSLGIDTTGGSGTSSPACGALYVYFGSAWHHTAGGGLVAVTNDRTFLASDYTQEVKIKAGDGYHTWTLPQTSPLDSCWHAFLYNDSSGSTPGTLRLNTETGPALWGYVFVGGGGYVQSDGSGGYYGWGVEQYRLVKTISGTTYTVLASDENLLLDCTHAQGCDITVPQASATGNFPAGFRFHVRNSSAGSSSSPYGAVTITPTTSTIDGQAALTVFPRETVGVSSDATNYKCERGRPPAGIVEVSGSTLTLTAAHNGKLVVYTGSGTCTISGDANLNPGFKVEIRNAGSSQASLVQYSRADGGTDYIPPSRAYVVSVPDNDDSGTHNYAMTGLSLFGLRQISSSDTVARSDMARQLVYSGSGSSTLTFFAGGADDKLFACQPQNFSSTLSTSGNMTLAVPNGYSLNGVLNGTYLLPVQRGVWAFFDGSTGWWLCTGNSPLLSPGSSGTISLAVSGGTDITFDVTTNSLDPTTYLTNGGGYAQYATMYAGSSGNSPSMLAAPTTNGFWVYNSLVTAAAAVSPAWTNLAGASGTFLAGQGATTAPAMVSTGTLASILQNYISGFQLSAPGGASTLTITAGTATDSTNAYMLTQSGTFTKTTGSFTAGTGNGALDTGSIAASTWYHVYAISKAAGANPDFLLSLSASSPTMPATYTLFRRIGSVKTDSSKDILGFNQYAGDFFWKIPVLDVAGTALATTATTLTLASVPSGIKVRAYLTGGITGASLSTFAYLSGADQTDEAPSGTFVNIEENVASAFECWYFQVWTSTTQTMRMRGSAASGDVNMTTRGWYDDRGQNGF